LKNYLCGQAEKFWLSFWLDTNSRASSQAFLLGTK
jgi:hypothetical protein